MSKRMATKAPSHEEYTKGKGISNIEQGISNDEERTFPKVKQLVRLESIIECRHLL